MSKPPVFALIDANNFFVSCERLFRPDLATKPVLVRSSNDGCVVARSNEVKRLGIAMGVPVFKIRHLIRAHSIIEFSGSFELYGDISQRLTETLRQFCPRIEVYSVDESFLDLSELAIKHYDAWARQVRKHIWQAIGIPVSIGIARTKTLAKLASELAKHDVSGPGSMSLVTNNRQLIATALANTPLKDVWGIGRQLAPKLQAEGIMNAWQLSQLEPRHAQQLMGIRGRQLVAELDGTSCYSLEPFEQVRKSLERTRTLGADTNKQYVIEAALSSLGTSACASLRTHQLLARQAGFFITTNKHKPGYRRWFRSIPLDTPSHDTGQIISQLAREFGEIFSPTQFYHRVGVLLYDLLPEQVVQIDLLGYVNIEGHLGSEQRMQTIDHINNQYGKGTIRYAAEQLSHSWQPRHNLRSPHYTTRWNELPEAHIKNTVL